MKLRRIRTSVPPPAQGLVSSARLRLLALAATFALIALAAIAAFGIANSKTVEAQSPGDRKPSQDFNTLSAAGNGLPTGLWSDSVTMWIADTVDDKIYAYNMSDKQRDASKDFNTLDAAGNKAPYGIWSDGTTMWVADWEDDKIYAYKMSDKSRDESKDFNTLNAAGNNDPDDIWSDGTTMWVADYGDDKIYAYSMYDKSRDSSKDFAATLDAAGNDDLDDIWSDGFTMWVSDYVDNKIYAYKMSDKSRDSSKDFSALDAGNVTPTGIWSDGFTMWVADTNDDKLYAYHAFPTPPAERPDAPAKPTLTAGTSSITVKWTAPLANGARITDYDVQYCGWTQADVDYCKNVSNWQDWHHSGTATTATITGLDAANWYSVKVSAVNSVRESEWSPSAFIKPITRGSDGDRNPAQDFNTLSAAGNNDPAGIWSNGATMWVADYNDYKLYAYNMSDKQRDPSKDFNNLSAGIGGIWSNGATMWVANEADNKLYAYNMSNKSRDASKDFDTLSAAGNTNAWGIWSDGTTMWVSDYTDAKLYAYRMSDKQRDPSKDFNALVSEGGSYRLRGIWADEDTMWTADYNEAKVFAYWKLTRSRNASRDYATLKAVSNESPVGLWSNGVTIWVADETDDKIYAYHAFRRIPAPTVTAMEHENGDWLKIKWDSDDYWIGTQPYIWRIRYSTDQGASWTHMTKDVGGFSEASIYNVKAGTEYWVQVQAWSQWSEIGKATTRSKAQGAQTPKSTPTPVPTATPVPPGNAISNCYDWYKDGILVDHSHPGTGCILDWYYRSGHSHQLADGSNKPHSH